MTTKSRLWFLTLIILLGAILRIALLTDNRFHSDEALFATLGRLIISGRDPLLSETSLLVDKPPFFTLTLAAGLSICWGCEITARLPGMFTSVISLALTARLAYRLYRSDEIAIFSTIFLTLSPFAILFAPTVFTDPQMTMWLLAALVAIIEKNWGRTGLFYGLALATKQNALFFLPLLAGVGIVSNAKSGIPKRDIVQWAWRFGLGIGICVLLMAVWDMLRQAPNNFWAIGFDVNNPGRLIRRNELGIRASAWLRWVGIFTGYPLVNTLVLSMLMLLPVGEIRAHYQSRSAAYSFSLLTFSILYLVFLWLVAFPIFDRYLLSLVPLIAVLVGRAGQLLKARNKLSTMGLSLVLVIMLSNSAWRALNKAYPTGSTHGTTDGIDQAAIFLSSLPDGTVVYHQSLGWLLNWYLSGAYIYPATFDTPEALVNDLQTFGNDKQPRYLILAQWDSLSEIEYELEKIEYKLQPITYALDHFGHRNFTIYRLDQNQ